LPLPRENAYNEKSSAVRDAIPLAPVFFSSPFFSKIVFLPFRGGIGVVFGCNGPPELGLRLGGGTLKTCALAGMATWFRPPTRNCQNANSIIAANVAPGAASTLHGPSRILLVGGARRPRPFAAPWGLQRANLIPNFFASGVLPRPVRGSRIALKKKKLFYLKTGTPLPSRERLFSLPAQGCHLVPEPGGIQCLAGVHLRTIAAALADERVGFWTFFSSF